VFPACRFGSVWFGSSPVPFGETSVGVECVIFFSIVFFFTLLARAVHLLLVGWFGLIWSLFGVGRRSWFGFELVLDLGASDPCGSAFHFSLPRCFADLI